MNQAIEFFGEPLDGKSPSLASVQKQAEERIRLQHSCWIRNFPTDVDTYIGFLERFGNTLPNYGSKTELAAYNLHPRVNRVRFEDRNTVDKYLHETGDPLLLHSARSWREP